ncbi:MAG: hypothetical protein IJD42_05360 [Clostridia bacterium]|nr:hypothetical protein [Clostridia bacterium]
MKKTLRIVALMLVLVMSVCALASCGVKLSGEYKESLTGNITYEFSGSKYTQTIDNIIGNDTVIEGKYEIDEDAGKITFTYEVDGEEKTSTENFSQGEEDGVKYIKIGVLKYNKQ